MKTFALFQLCNAGRIWVSVASNVANSIEDAERNLNTFSSMMGGGVVLELTESEAAMRVAHLNHNEMEDRIADQMAL